MKSDVKGALHTDFTKEESLELESLSIINTGKNLEELNIETQEIINFLKQSGSLLAYRKLINGYETFVLENNTRFMSYKAEQEQNISYIEFKNKKLNELNINNQKTELPLKLQVSINGNFKSIKDEIVGNNIEIVNLQNDIAIQSDIFNQTQKIESFIEQAKAIIETEYNGFIVHDKFLQLIGEFSETEDMRGNVIKLRLLNDIENIKLTFSNRLYSQNGVAITKPFQLYEYLLAGLILSLVNILLISYFKSK